MTKEQLGRRLDGIRQRREELREGQREAGAALATTIREAQAAGMTLTEICHRAGVSRQGAYKLLKRECP